MTNIYKSTDGEHAVRERYLKFLKYWPGPSQEFRIPTREGETFVIACGDANAPPLLLFHGSAGNSAMWMGDVAQWAKHFRVCSVDMIGEPGLSAQSRPRLRSEAYALWLDDVMDGLSIRSAAIVGVSLGGWLAVDYAIRRPGRAEALALLCPGGIGRQKMGILFKAAALRLMGSWGTRKLRQIILGPSPAQMSPAMKAFADFVALIHTHFRPRMEKLPIFSDQSLKGLTVPVLAIVGAKDVMLDSAGTKCRLERNVSRAEVRMLPETGHFVGKQTEEVLQFLMSHAYSNVGEACEHATWRRSSEGAAREMKILS